MDKRICRLIYIFMLLWTLLIMILSIPVQAILTESNGQNNVSLVIDTDEKKLYVVSDGRIIKKYTVATGKKETPSPLGDFQVIQKDKWGKGFGTSWMGLNVPWGKYGIHGTNRPESIGRSASGGCIRMRNRDVDELFKIVNIGTPVKIIGGPYDLLGYGFRIINLGDRGSDVQIVQKKLKEKGYYNGNLDGIYGRNLERAVIEFEKDNGLPLDYNINPEFFAALGVVLFE